MNPGLLFVPNHELIAAETGVVENDDFHFVAKGFCSAR